jgi:hypothetical protein
MSTGLNIPQNTTHQVRNVGYTYPNLKKKPERKVR